MGMGGIQIYRKMPRHVLQMDREIGYKYFELFGKRRNKKKI